MLYYYFLDPEFGRVHVRIETWFPFTVQIYVNGHDWLAQQLTKRRAGFVQHDNCFTQLDDPAAAQGQADRFFSLAWKSRLYRWAKQVNPLLREVPWLRGLEYRWVIDQFEYSSDVLFRSTLTDEAGQPNHGRSGRLRPDGASLWTLDDPPANFNFLQLEPGDRGFSATV